MSNQIQAEVRLRRLVILGDPDGFGAGVGDYYYNFNVNDQEIVRRDSAAATSVEPGDSITLDEGVVIDVAPDGLIRVTGQVMDRDGFIAGGDEWCGDVRLVVRARDLPHNGDWHNLSRYFKGEDDTGQVLYLGMRRLGA